MRAATRAAGMADTRPSAALPSRGAVAPRKALVGSGQQNAAAGAPLANEQEKCRPRAAATPLLQRVASRLASCDLDADDDVCTPSPNVTVRARRKRRRRKALGSAEKTFDDANPASPPTSPSATVPPTSPMSLPSTPTIKSPPTHAPLSEPSFQVEGLQNPPRDLEGSGRWGLALRPPVWKSTSVSGALSTNAP